MNTTFFLIICFYLFVIYFFNAGIEFLSRTRIEGAYFFPGMPNATEVLQEMDRMFSAWKAGVYRNRQALWEAMPRELRITDIGLLIFGGEIPIEGNDDDDDDDSNGNMLVLEDTVELYLSSDHMKSALLKCGFIPATRSALSSDRMRVEIKDAELNVDVDHSDIDLVSDAINELIEHFEIRNHRLVEMLVEKGYYYSVDARRFVKRITKEQTAGRDAHICTKLGTRERQDLLAKTNIAGIFFQITEGGWVKNSSDFLLGRERKLMKDAAVKMKNGMYYYLLHC